MPIPEKPLEILAALAPSLSCRATRRRATLPTPDSADRLSANAQLKELEKSYARLAAGPTMPPAWSRPFWCSCSRCSNRLSQTY